MAAWPGRAGKPGAPGCDAMPGGPRGGPVPAQSEGGLAPGLRLGSAVAALPGWDDAFVPVSLGGASGPAGSCGRMPGSAGVGRVRG